MENIADALKVGFAMLVFVIAFTVFFQTVSLATRVTESIIKDSDKSSYLTYLTDRTYVDDDGNRIVTLEDVQASCYRYFVENSAVTILDKNGDIIVRYDVQLELFCNEWYSRNSNERATYYNQVNAVLEEVDKMSPVSVKHDYNENEWEDIFERIYGQDVPAGSMLHKIACPWKTNPALNAQRVDSDFSRYTSIF